MQTADQPVRLIQVPAKFQLPTAIKQRATGRGTPLATFDDLNLSRDALDLALKFLQECSRLRGPSVIDHEPDALIKN